MKNTITLLVAVLIIACSLPSCGVTLVKRQHGPGYYVNKNPRFPTAESERNDNKHIKPSSTKSENIIEDEESYIAETVTLVSPSNELPVNTETTDQSVDTAPENVSKKEDFNTVINPVKPSLVEWASNTRLAQKMNSDSADQQSSSAARNSEGGLSLFGLVILILVILWLVAVLSGGWGLGGFIHVLLIIALILLILWLLRII
ncbi:MAG: hypothetical protein HYZ43_14255 [Flavobacteriia bacterium]|nr:hypothetical protein [Flavobacteriia bacterium]